MKAEPTTTFLEGLNPAQREAVEHLYGPLLVVAGAGSGKTRVLTLRIARLIDQHGVPPSRIFAVTFTNKAAQEMKTRVGHLLGSEPSGLWIGTFHALSARLLRREAEAIGFTRRFTIYDEDDRLSLIRRLMEQRSHSTKLFPPRAVQSVISSAKNRLLSPEALAGDAPFDQLVQVAADVYAALGPALRSANAMDFDDLLLHPLQLFRERPDRLAAYQERFAFVLVDEFQDTNAAQYRLVRALGAHGNVAAVGDDDQSIYSWRGADVRNMRDFQRDFPGTTVVRLEQNYRSTGTVLEAANAVIQENTGRLGKTLHTTRQGGEALTLLSAADERDEAEWVVRELGERAAKSDWVLEEMAILYRTNAQSRAFEEALRRSGTPYRIVGAISFYDRREVKDLLAYLRLVANPADDEAFLRAVAVPRRGLGDSSLAVLQGAATQWKKPLLEAATIAERIPELRPNAKEALRQFGAFIETARQGADALAPAAILDQIVRAIDYENVLLAEGPEGAERWENVRELLASAAAWSEVAPLEETEGTPLERFLAEAALFAPNDSAAGDARGVTLMTLHTAKGLEWPVVVLAGLEDGLFPLARAEEEHEGLEEERRLCYVGLTRAKDKLYVTWAKSRRRGGELRPSRPSRFLASLPSGVLDERRTSGTWSVGRWSDRSGTWKGQGRRWTGAQFGDEDIVPARVPAPQAADDESQDVPRYIRGERVRHRKFGSGVIQGLSGTGRDLKVSVMFDDQEIGLKQLLVTYAGLEREWESA